MFIPITREHHEIITSTQDRAKELANEIKSDTWFVVTANEQTKGRGTHGRNWTSPPNLNLYATYVFPFPENLVHLLIHLPQVIAYSVMQTLKTYGLEAQFKWINDVLLNQKKVCGILCESDRSKNLPGYYAVLVGIGINVGMDKKMCESLPQPATSLLLELGHTIDKEELLNTLSTKISVNLENLITHNFDYFYKDISEKLAFKGEKIKVYLDGNHNTPKEGILEGIDLQGMLLLKTSNGVEKLFSGKIIRNK